MKQSQQARRKFLQIGGAGVVTALFGSLPKISNAESFSQNGKPIVVKPEEGLHIITRRKVPITIKISKNRDGLENISFCTEDMTPGRKMRVHKHLNNDEIIFVHKGEGRLTIGEDFIDVKAGTVAFVPRGVWHGLDNTGNENLLMVFGYSPAGFEEYFVENGTTAEMPVKQKTEEEYAITEKKYGMVYKDKV